MDKKIKRYEDYYGACWVLENYIEGALNDFENNDVDIDSAVCLEHSINALYVLGSSNYKKYKDRFEKIGRRKLEDL